MKHFPVDFDQPVNWSLGTQNALHPHSTFFTFHHEFTRSDPASISASLFTTSSYITYLWCCSLLSLPVISQPRSIGLQCRPVQSELLLLQSLCRKSWFWKMRMNWVIRFIATINDFLATRPSTFIPFDEFSFESLRNPTNLRNDMQKLDSGWRGLWRTKLLKTSQWLQSAGRGKYRLHISELGDHASAGCFSSRLNLYLLGLIFHEERSSMYGLLNSGCYTLIYIDSVYYTPIFLRSQHNVLCGDISNTRNSLCSQRYVWLVNHGD